METGKLLISRGALRAGASIGLQRRRHAPGVRRRDCQQADKPADLKVWDLKTGKVIFELEGHVPGVAGVPAQPDGKRIASLAGNLFGKCAELKVWDAETGKEVQNLQDPAMAGRPGTGIRRRSCLQS